MQSSAKVAGDHAPSRRVSRGAGSLSSTQPSCTCLPMIVVASGRCMSSSPAVLKEYDTYSLDQDREIEQGVVVFHVVEVVGELSFCVING